MAETEHLNVLFTCSSPELGSDCEDEDEEEAASSLTDWAMQSTDTQKHTHKKKSVKARQMLAT